MQNQDPGADPAWRASSWFNTSRSSATSPAGGQTVRDGFEFRSQARGRHMQRLTSCLSRHCARPHLCAECWRQHGGGGAPTNKGHFQLQVSFYLTFHPLPLLPLLLQLRR